MKILITSGGTTEKIDSVRSITNHSTGRLGKMIAETFLEKGFDVTLVTTAAALKPQQHEHLAIYQVTTVASLAETLEPLVKSHDVLIHSMAVSDYTPVYMTDLDSVKEVSDLDSLLTKTNTESKISSQSDYQVLFLKKTPKLISLVKKWNPAITLIGFKLLVNVEKEQLLSVAKESLLKNEAAYILANDLSQINEQQHHAYLVSSDDCIELKTKAEIAKLICRKIIDND
ncbi:phosphopantothenate--cysteine ligase [Streptococcus pseudoporcinus]|uniref:Phosphopantothenate--cysteine ligase n=1 Tax=Streptococcus pseudoporcinus LQ 940-04 TaxID=875093 RepID=G5KBY3_9STRE|nr:phosphopantothenate--cysteine ligase [Streptococcus pseudoporcinus]EFR44294.1 phosphopantothenate--cysteine ligase [Streptococcus pseudoporcinus SPIN 20026]EHI65750.1 phosphopantothenate--cysteine ligase [Streptococcus pseudoporcinus LQ 940-04]VEF92980.1 phosphopantothenate--cysteine ligase [Streptococcus pseudoporcinus]